MIYAPMKGTHVRDRGAAAWPVVGFRDTAILERTEAVRAVEGLAPVPFRGRS